MDLSHIKRYSGISSAIVCSIALLASCSSSKGGMISGKVEEVLFHGAYNPNNPNRTITPLGNVRLILSDTMGTAVDTLVTQSDGTFSLALAEGTYILSSQERSNDLGPGSSPSPQRITLRSGETATILLRYQVYAP